MSADQPATVRELAQLGFADAVEIGRGGFGVVFRCHEVSVGRTVAVKLLHTDLDATNRARFFREGRAMGRLSGHPNVVEVLQVGETPGGRPFIVMPFLARGSLADRIERDGPVPWPDATTMGVRLAGALESAHRAGTLHRDVKPGNVLLSDYGEAQLTDFGIARMQGGFETQTGQFTGSVAYSAPDVLEGEPPSPRSDVYALGATLFTVVAGYAAFARKPDEELLAQVLRIGRSPVPDLRAAGIPDDLCAVLEHAMAKKATDRPQMTEFGKALQEVQQRAGLAVAEMAVPAAAPTAPADPITVRAAPPPPPPLQPTERAEPAPPATAGRRWPRTLAIAVLVLLLIGVATLLVVIGVRAVSTSVGAGEAREAVTAAVGHDRLP
ncbi:serine/threonine-protein kinase [Pseudonocardia sp. CA-107938]|uniref:serine/threonine-protein kinase n=1 Tax=Pseudonocardia sp. CA-107938 TaxID=3240021 RepID=UPI003D8FA0D3